MSENKDKNKLELKLQGNLYVGEIDGKEFGFRKITWGEKNKIISISQRINPNGQPSFDMSEFNINLILATVKKAPFALSKESLESYPDAKLIDKLLSVATQMNIADPVDIQNL